MWFSDLNSTLNTVSHLGMERTLFKAENIIRKEYKLPSVLKICSLALTFTELKSALTAFGT